MKNQNKDKIKLTKTFQTYAVLDEKKQYPNTNVNIPSAESVEDAKNWVDDNQK